MKERGKYITVIKPEQLARGEIKERLVTVAKGIQVVARPGKTDQETIVKQGDKLNVKGSKGKLNILSFDEANGTVTVSLLKVKETWPIKQLVESIKDGSIYQ